jgi:hypothetical protein
LVQKAQFPFLAQVARALISAMLLPLLAREETKHFFVIPPTTQLSWNSAPQTQIPGLSVVVCKD